MPYLYPHTNLNQQNLDWMISEIKELRDLISSIVVTGGGNVMIVTDPADIRDTDLIYVYMGTDVGSTWVKGHMYTWSGSAWVDLGLVFPTYPLPIQNGGTGAGRSDVARDNLGITPANIDAEPEITSNNPLAITKGGTGAITAPAALQNLGAEPAFTTLPVTKGGTGADNVPDARTSLGLGSAALQDTPIGVQYGGTGATSAATARANLHALGTSDVTFQQWEGPETTVAAGATDHVEITATKSGYTLEGIVSYFGSGTSNFKWTDIYFSGNTIYMYFQNVSSATAKITPKCRAIYVKTV